MKCCIGWNKRDTGLESTQQHGGISSVVVVIVVIAVIIVNVDLELLVHAVLRAPAHRGGLRRSARAPCPS
jgi:uncharacterized protein HemY